jgi:hypothetical protein
VVNEVKAMNFANPEAVIDGLPVEHKIKLLSTLKDNLVASTPAAGVTAPAQPPAASPAKASRTYSAKWV